MTWRFDNQSNCLWLNLKNNNMIGNSQDGFTMGKSHLTNLVTFYDGATALVDRNRATDIIYPNICKRIWRCPPWTSFSQNWRWVGLMNAPFSYWKASLQDLWSMAHCPQWWVCPSGLGTIACTVQHLSNRGTKHTLSIFADSIELCGTVTHAKGKGYHPERPGQAWEVGQCKPCEVQ